MGQKSNKIKLQFQTPGRGKESSWQNIDKLVKAPAPANYELFLVFATKSEVCAHKFYAAMRIKTHLDNALYLSSL